MIIGEVVQKNFITFFIFGATLEVNMIGYGFAFPSQQTNTINIYLCNFAATIDNLIQTTALNIKLLQSQWKADINYM